MAKFILIAALCILSAALTKAAFNKEEAIKTFMTRAEECRGEAGAADCKCGFSCSKYNIILLYLKYLIFHSRHSGPDHKISCRRQGGQMHALLHYEEIWCGACVLLISFQ